MRSGIPSLAMWSAICFWAITTSAQPLTRLPNTTISMPPTPPVSGYQTVQAFGTLGNSTFINPLAIATPPGETNRIFVVEQAGIISVISNLAAPNRSVFLNIGNRGRTDQSEEGLLGLAFHPGYATNGTFFIYYTANTTSAAGSGRHDRLAKLQVSANPNVALTNEIVLFEQFDQEFNHNGGDLHFGPDGYLYLSLGDEGAANDSRANSQRINQDFFSGLLRLDVDNRPGNLMPNPHPANTNNPARTIHYRIPADNPWVGATNFNGAAVNPAAVRTEFYAVGLRNPWRFSFDPLTGHLWLADVGQGAWEEVNLVRKGGNYGWNYREGLHGGPRSNPAGLVFDDPIFEYSHSSTPSGFYGLSITGGRVYRGAAMAQLYGMYVFADYVSGNSGNVFALRYNGTNVTQAIVLLNDGGIAGFGVDPRNGDILTADQSQDTIKRLTYTGTTPVGTPLPTLLSGTGVFGDVATLTPAPGVMPYEVNAPFWSDGAIKTRWFSVPNVNRFITFSAEGNWSFPTGAVWIKHFELELTNGVASSRKRLETRLLVKNTNGVYGVTYRWTTPPTNAVLVAEAGLDENFTVYEGATAVRTQTWRYPSRAECLACHTPANGFVAGFNSVQLNRDFNYGGATTNQIAALSDAGYFTAPVTNLNTLRALAHVTDASSSLEWRVRSYLAANCAQCHQPGGEALGTWTANISVPTANAGLVNGALNNNGGNPNARVVAPGWPADSMLLTRISTRGPGKMPPIGSTVVDTNAVALLAEWIAVDATNVIVRPPLQVSAALEVSGDQAQISFSQPENTAVAVEHTTNLVSGSNVWRFLDVPENRPKYPAVSTPVTIEDPLSNAPQKFFRLKLSSP